MKNGPWILLICAAAIFGSAITIMCMKVSSVTNRNQFPLIKIVDVELVHRDVNGVDCTFVDIAHD